MIVLVDSAQNLYDGGMSYLEHILNCNRHEPDDFISFQIEREKMGWMQKTFAHHLLALDDVFKEYEESITLDSSLKNAQDRTQACAPILEQLHREGIIDSWVGEQYAVTHVFGEVPRMMIERAAVSFFGVRGYGVHINGLVQKPDGIYIWCARRAKDKPFWPGKLDQIVAGGQPAGIGLMQNVIKESAEEANIPESLAKQAKLVSEIHYQAQTHRGMHVDTLFNYDLWLPEDFVPQNTDGEVDDFELMPLQEMAVITNTTDNFKDNCNLVNIDLLIRLGLIDPSHTDYAKIHEHLYAPAKL